MSDDIDIREGGVVAVDTGSLRAAADRYAVLGAQMREVAGDLGAQARAVSALGPAAAYGGSVPFRLQNAAFAAASDADDLVGIARALRELADTYEIVELRARRELAVGVQARAAAAQAADLAAQRHPDAAHRADLATRGRDLDVGRGLVSMANGGVGLAGGVAGIAYPQLAGALDAALLSLPVAAQSLQALIRRLGTGTIVPGRGLSGDTAAVEVRQEGAATVTVPPRDLAGALSRIPDTSRVRVETYTMPDGTATYAVYLAGTRDFPPEAGDDPWDLTSDTRMYLGEDAAAYAAVVEALDRAGVPEGAELYLFGHSQGGLIADWLAVHGGYRTRMLVTAGSPTEADAGAGTLSVQLRHTDDLVQSLAAGGSDGRVGTAGSLVVERTGDPTPGIQDLSFAPHRLAAYVATARMLDAAPDPRTAPMRGALAELRAATSVTAVEYDARRVPRQTAKGGGGV